MSDNLNNHPFDCALTLCYIYVDSNIADTWNY